MLAVDATTRLVLCPPFPPSPPFWWTRERVHLEETGKREILKQQFLSRQAIQGRRDSLSRMEDTHKRSKKLSFSSSSRREDPAQTTLGDGHHLSHLVGADSSGTGIFTCRGRRLEQLRGESGETIYLVSVCTLTKVEDVGTSEVVAAVVVGKTRKQ